VNEKNVFPFMEDE